MSDDYTMIEYCYEIVKRNGTVKEICEEHTFPVDLPWYKDLQNLIVGLFDNQLVAFGGVCFAVIFFVLAIIALAKWAPASDLAPDAWDVEDYIAELNEQASPDDESSGYYDLEYEDDVVYDEEPSSASS